MEAVHEAEEFIVIPEEPRSVEETGISFGFLTDLALKTIYFSGELQGQALAQSLKLPFSGVVDTILDFLKRNELASVSGSKGLGERGFRYVLTEKGMERVHEALERDLYVGPAPVSFDMYTRMVRAQSITQIKVREADVVEALSNLVVNPKMVHKLGPAMNSGQAVFLYGPSGNGKTTYAKAMARMLKGYVFIPYAVLVNGSIIQVFDPLSHHRVPPEVEQRLRLQGVDERWVPAQRPVVMVGGELTMQNLDLIYNPTSRFYQAPLQMKANNGLFLIDDFGRQQIEPRELLNRWIVPLDTHVDYLTLHTGMKIEVPFDQLVVFSTNLDPKALVDEAFLRRIRHKIEVGNPTEEEFYQIFKQACEARGIPFDEEAFEYLLREYYILPKRELRAVHARDLLDQIVDIATFRDVEPVLSKEFIDEACSAYFAEL